MIFLLWWWWWWWWRGGDNFFSLVMPPQKWITNRPPRMNTFSQSISKAEANAENGIIRGRVTAIAQDGATEGPKMSSSRSKSGGVVIVVIVVIVGVVGVATGVGLILLWRQQHNKWQCSKNTRGRSFPCTLQCGIIKGATMHFWFGSSCVTITHDHNGVGLCWKEWWVRVLEMGREGDLWHFVAFGCLAACDGILWYSNHHLVVICLYGNMQSRCMTVTVVGVMVCDGGWSKWGVGDVVVLLCKKVWWWICGCIWRVFVIWRNDVVICVRWKLWKGRDEWGQLMTFVWWNVESQSFEWCFYVVSK